MTLCEYLKFLFADSMQCLKWYWFAWNIANKLRYSIVISVLVYYYFFNNKLIKRLYNIETVGFIPFFLSFFNYAVRKKKKRKRKKKNVKKWIKERKKEMEVAVFDRYTMGVERKLLWIPFIWVKEYIYNFINTDDGYK